MTHIIRIPDSDATEYDHLFAIPEGMTPAEAVAKINAAIEAVDEEEDGYGRTGDALESIIENNCDHATSHVASYDPATDIITWECNECPEQWCADPTEDDRMFEPLVSGGCVACQ